MDEPDCRPVELFGVKKGSSIRKKRGVPHLSFFLSLQDSKCNRRCPGDICSNQSADWFVPLFPNPVSSISVCTLVRGCFFSGRHHVGKTTKQHRCPPRQMAGLFMPVSAPCGRHPPKDWQVFSRISSVSQRTRISSSSASLRSCSMSRRWETVAAPCSSRRT